MNDELVAIKEAQEEGDFDKVRELSDQYVTTHTDEYNDHNQIVNDASSEAEARSKIVDMIEKLRGAGLEEHHWRAEAFQHHRWHPLDVSGVAGPQPVVRNETADANPKVRAHK